MYGHVILLVILLATSENTVNSVIADILDGMKRSWNVRADPTGELRYAHSAGGGVIIQVVRGGWD